MGAEENEEVSRHSLPPPPCCRQAEGGGLPWEMAEDEGTSIVLTYVPDTSHRL